MDSEMIAEANSNSMHAYNTIIIGLGKFVGVNLRAINNFEMNSILWPHRNPNTNLQGHLQIIKTIIHYLYSSLLLNNSSILDTSGTVSN